MSYPVKIPFYVRWFYPSYLVWRKPTKEKLLYITFDDGPHPSITPWALKVLEQYNAKATFFCVGANAKKYPDVLQQITANGHSIANHTQNHLKGWKTSLKDYVANTKLAAKYIDSNLFRPPYGRIKHTQAKAIKKLGYEIIMWDVLSGDFDQKLTGEECYQNVIKNAKEGSIIIFHDSEKAEERLKIALPKVLEYYSRKGYSFKLL